MSDLRSARDMHSELLRAVQALNHEDDDAVGGPVTSDLSIDEALLLHSVGWRPIDLVCGASVASVPMGSWKWQSGEITAASVGHTRAVATAVARLTEECATVAGHGVVGVKVTVNVEPHRIDVILVGTAVRPVDASDPVEQSDETDALLRWVLRRRRHAARPEDRRSVTAPFVSDLTGRDFALLMNAGWEPLGLAFGASYVHAPRRSPTTAVRQSVENIELTNFTDAIYDARESAMERMQASALQMGATGVVAVHISEGPMEFASHAIGFTTWGTAMRLGSSGHRYVQPRVVLPLDDRRLLFDAAALRGV
jgi:uncharacterized protein YbjQ (UPF0145 family)